MCSGKQLELSEKLWTISLAFVFTLAYLLKNSWRFFKALQLFCTTSVLGHESISALPELWP
jgi:hypothetical protein